MVAGVSQADAGFQLPALVVDDGLEPTSVLADPSTDLTGFAQLVLNAAMSKNYALLVVLLLAGVVVAARKFGGPYVPWLKTAIAELLLFQLGSVFGYLGTALIAGKPFSAAMVLHAVLFALAGQKVKELFGAAAEKRAEVRAAAAVAQAKSATDTDLSAYLDGGVK